MADNPFLPLVVDLDGTLIRTDMMWESLSRLLRRNPLAIFQCLYWWTRGRAFLKQKLAARVRLDPAVLPYQEPFIDWLRKERLTGRKIVLATASDVNMARPVAAYLGLFDEILASDGHTNLRHENKRLALVRNYGERGFDYAGNSRDDLAVWRSARLAIVVNASAGVLREAARCAQPGPSFCDGFSPLAVARSFFVELCWRSGFLLAGAAGLLLALGFPKFDIAGFAWVAPALMLASIHGRPAPERFRVACLGGAAFWLVSLYWLLLMPAVGYPILGWLALAAYVSLYFGLWAVLAAPPREPTGANPLLEAPTRLSMQSAFVNLPWSSRARWALGGAAAWVALEMIRARFLGGFPWDFLGVSQFQLLPLIQIAAFTGVYGVSFLIVWFSLGLYSAAFMILQQPAKRQAWLAEIVLPLVAVLACYFGGFLAINQGVTSDSSVPAIAVQPSVPQTLIWNPQDDARRFKELLQLSQLAITRATNHCDLLVWPESAVPDIDEPTYQAINQFVISNRVWLILNGEDGETHASITNYYNAAFLIGPDGRWRQVYHKRKLVIFGEYVPLANWLPFLQYLTPITGGWTPGDTPAIFEFEGPPAPGGAALLHCAPLICFEDTFPGAARDSAGDDVDFLVNLTNDGWFEQSAAQWQHAANAVFRAVENGLPLLRCANNGVTCLINRHGGLVSVFRAAEHGVYGRGALEVQIPALSPAQLGPRTFYNRHGDWFGWACVALTAVNLTSKFLLRTGRNSRGNS